MNFNQLWMAAHWICSVCAQSKIYCLDFSRSEGNYCTFGIALYFAYMPIFVGFKNLTIKMYLSSFECR